MWQELSNDTIPKGSAIYPSKDKLPFRPLKPGQFIPIGPTAEIKQYYVQIPKVFFIKYCVMKVRCLLPMERKYFFILQLPKLESRYSSYTEKPPQNGSVPEVVRVPISGLPGRGQVLW